MLLTQQTNYLRLNKCILHSLLKSTRDNDTVKRSLAILAMDWRGYYIRWYWYFPNLQSTLYIGPHGYLYELKRIDDVYCARLVQALCMPKSLDQLSKFWDTLKGLLSWKVQTREQWISRLAGTDFTVPEIDANTWPSISKMAKLEWNHTYRILITPGHKSRYLLHTRKAEEISSSIEWFIAVE